MPSFNLRSGPSLPAVPQGKRALSPEHIDEICKLSETYLAGAAEAVEFSEDDLLSNLRALYEISRQQGRKMSAKHRSRVKALAMAAGAIAIASPAEAKDNSMKQATLAADNYNFMPPAAGAAKKNVDAALDSLAKCIFSSSHDKKKLSSEQISEAKQDISAIRAYYKDNDAAMRLLASIEQQIDANAPAMAEKDCAKLRMYHAAYRLKYHLDNYALNDEKKPALKGGKQIGAVRSLGEPSYSIGKMEQDLKYIEDLMKYKFSKETDADFLRGLEYALELSWNCIKVLKKSYRTLDSEIKRINGEKPANLDAQIDRALAVFGQDMAYLRGQDYFGNLAGTITSRAYETTKPDEHEFERKIDRLFAKADENVGDTMRKFRNIDFWDNIANSDKLGTSKNYAEFGINILPNELDWWSKGETPWWPAGKGSQKIVTVFGVPKLYDELSAEIRVMTVAYEVFEKSFSNLKAQIKAGDPAKMDAALGEMCNDYLRFLSIQMTVAPKIAEYDLQGVELVSNLAFKALDVAMYVSMAFGVGELALAGKGALELSLVALRQAATKEAKVLAAKQVGRDAAAFLKEIATLSGKNMLDAGLARAINISVVFTGLGMLSEGSASSKMSNMLADVQNNQLGTLKQLRGLLSQDKPLSKYGEIPATLAEINALIAELEDKKYAPGDKFNITRAMGIFSTTLAQTLLFEAGFGTFNAAKAWRKSGATNAFSMRSEVKKLPKELQALYNEAAQNQAGETNITAAEQFGKLRESTKETNPALSEKFFELEKANYEKAAIRFTKMAENAEQGSNEKSLFYEIASENFQKAGLMEKAAAAKVLSGNAAPAKSPAENAAAESAPSSPVGQERPKAEYSSTSENAPQGKRPTPAEKQPASQVETKPETAPNKITLDVDRPSQGNAPSFSSWQHRNAEAEALWGRALSETSLNAAIWLFNKAIEIYQDELGALGRSGDYKGQAKLLSEIISKSDMAHEFMANRFDAMWKENRLTQEDIGLFFNDMKTLEESLGSNLVRFRGLNSFVEEMGISDYIGKRGADLYNSRPAVDNFYFDQVGGRASALVSEGKYKEALSFLSKEERKAKGDLGMENFFIIKKIQVLMDQTQRNYLPLQRECEIFKSISKLFSRLQENESDPAMKAKDAECATHYDLRSEEYGRRNQRAREEFKERTKFFSSEEFEKFLGDHAAVTVPNATNALFNKSLSFFDKTFLGERNSQLLSAAPPIVLRVTADFIPHLSIELTKLDKKNVSAALLSMASSLETDCFTITASSIRSNLSQISKSLLQGKAFAFEASADKPWAGPNFTLRVEKSLDGMYHLDIGVRQNLAGCYYPSTNGTLIVDPLPPIKKNGLVRSAMDLFRASKKPKETENASTQPDANSMSVYTHEIMHYASKFERGQFEQLLTTSVTFSDRITWLDEGLTEWYSKALLKSKGEKFGYISYHGDVKTVDLIRQLVGERNLREAYFTNDFRNVERIFDSKLGDGAFLKAITYENSAQASVFILDAAKQNGITLQSGSMLTRRNRFLLEGNRL